ncbi:class I SAM-dependent methyltransferase [Vibrio sp. JC009]|uniref:class I SAM-dependent methyltransferase n=1 Tax=Vibrio sp. JC009 TaxID=2912314 RepID=UPI0023AEE0A2|nr:class I SAM-dependent methyltransferase [Vibrio sp. JC009]WED21853.1 class I SAM-dependent methyltransferase [Vibrio sp. JC009]
MKEMWDKRYSDDDYAYGTEVNDFVREQYSEIPQGKVLCLAEGEGRNAVFLAGKGYQVTAMDQSTSGLKKAEQLAEKLGVEIETQAADLAEFEIEPESVSGIISIAGHVPPFIRKRVHEQVVNGLAPGGIYLIEGYTARHLEMEGAGGPPATQIEMFYDLEELKQELSGLEFILAHETERHMSEGKFHQGDSAVVQIVARKPLV